MFSSFSESFSRFSPKKLLANYLSKQLAEFLDCDPNTIETNLVTDAHIKLLNIRIHPYVLESGKNDSTLPLVCEGWVEEFEFSWKWGTGFGEGAQAYIKDVHVRVRGVKLRVHASVVDHPHPQENSTTTTGNNISSSDASPASDPGGSGGDPDWKARYLQQIVDHLTLALESLEISIELPKQEENLQHTVYVVGKKIELITLGGPSSSSPSSTTTMQTPAPDGLRQRLSLGSLSAIIRQTINLDDGITTQELPLLDPVGYRAMVKRVSGRRFMDGIGAGLVITGERILSGMGTNATGVVGNALKVYAGIVQVGCLLQLQKMFGFDEASEDGQPETDCVDSVERDENKSSLFVLPVDYMSLTLQNGTNLRINECVLMLRTDGSVCRCESSKGSLWVDDQSINHTETGTWQVDFLRSSVSVDSHHSSDAQDGDSEKNFDASQDNPEVLANLELHIGQYRKIYQGFNVIMSLFDDSDTATPWTFEVKGDARISLVSSMGTRVKANLSRPRVRYIGSRKNDPGALPGIPCVLSWDSMNVHAPDLGDLSFLIPQVDATSDGLALTMTEAIAVNVDSANSLQGTVDFVNEFLNVMEGESTGVPVRLVLPTVMLQFRKEEMNIEIRNVVASAFDVNVREAIWWSGQGRFSVRNVQCDTFSNTMHLDVMSFSSSDETLSLFEPLEDIRAEVVEGRLVLKGAVAKVMVRQSSQSEGNPTSLWDVSVPIGMDVSLKGLIVYENEVSSLLLQLSHTEIKAVLLDRQSTLNIAWDTLGYDGFELSTGSARLVLSKDLFDISVEVSSFRSTTWPMGRMSGEGVKVRGKLKPTNSSGEAFPIDGIGFVDELGLSIRSVADLCVDGSFCLTEPIADIILKLSTGKIAIEMEKAVIALLQSSNSTTEGVASPSSLHFKVPLPVELLLPRIIVYSANGSNKLLEARSCLTRAYSAGDQTKIDCTWESIMAMRLTLLGGKVSLTLGLEQIVASLALESAASLDWPEGKFSAKGFQAKMVLESSRTSEDSFEIKGIGFIPMTCLSLEEISSLSLTDLVTLSAPVTSCSVEFSEGTCAMQLGDLDLVLDNPSKEPDSSIGSAKQPLETSLPFPVICSVPLVTVRYPFGAINTLRAESVLLELTPDVSSTSGIFSCSVCSIDQLTGHSFAAEVLLSQSDVRGSISCDDLIAVNYNEVSLSMRSLRCSIGVDFKPVTSEFGNGLWVDGVGAVTEAAVSISEIESFSSTGVGCLVFPLTGTKMLFNDGVLEICLGDVHWCHSKTSAPAQVPSQAEFSMEPFLATFRLPFPLKMLMCSAKVYNPDQMNPTLQWEKVSLECMAQNPVSGARLTWEKSLLYGVDVNTTAIDISSEGSQVTVKVSVASAFLNDTTRASFSVKSMTATMVVETSLETSVVGFPVDFMGQVIEIETNIEEINSLYVPSSGTLLSPLRKTKVSFYSGVSRIHLDQVYWHDLAGSQNQSSDASSLAEYASMFSFPIEISVNIARIDNDPFNSAYNSKQSTFGFKNFLCQVLPVKPSSFLVPFVVSKVEEVWYLQMVQVPSLQLRGCIDLRKPHCIQMLVLDVHTLYLSAEFTSMDWSSALTQAHESSPPVPLPHAKISELDLVLSGKGKLLAMKNSALHCKAFCGSETTNSDSLSKHYVAIVKKRIPYLLSNAEVLGSNVGDSIGISAASVVMKSTLMGSVAGVGARDAVGGALSLGKLSRGASESDRYHLGDFSRGIAAAAGSAAKRGSSMRGSDKYSVGDFTTGATSAAAEYTSKNRERLGGAAGSGTAMMVGAGLAGPIGLVAGAVIGGMAGKKAIKATVGEYTGKSGSTIQTKAGSDANGYPSTTRQIPSGSQTNNPESINSPQIQAGRAEQDADPFSVFASQETHLPTQLTQGDDLLDVFGSSDRAQSEQANAILASQQYDSSGAADPFSVFESQPAKTPEIPFNDPLSTFTRHEAPIAPGTGTTYHAPNQQTHVIESHRRTAGSAIAPSQRHQMNLTNLAQQTSAPNIVGVSCAPVNQQQQFSSVQPQATPLPIGHVVPTIRDASRANPSLRGNARQAAGAEDPPRQPQPIYHRHSITQQAGQGQQQEQQGYKFGDVTRGVIAKGKQKRGADGNKNYKFGDFTRGLFG